MGVYYIIRLTIWILLFFIVVLIMKKNHKNTKRNLIYLFAICIIGYSFSCNLNIESLFLKFDKYQDALFYTEGYIKNYLNIEGKVSNLIVLKNNKTIFIPKENKKYKINKNFYNNSYTSKTYESFVITEYSYKEDTFISILIKDKNDIKISDNLDTVFIQQNQNKKEDYHIYYAYIKDFESKYELTINDKKYIIK